MMHPAIKKRLLESLWIPIMFAAMPVCVRVTSYVLHSSKWPDAGAAIWSWLPPVVVGSVFFTLGLIAVWLLPRSPLALAANLGSRWWRPFVWGPTTCLLVFGLAVLLAWCWRGGTLPDAFPSEETAVQCVFVVLLGTATLSGLALAIARIEDVYSPRVVTMEDALELATTFLKRAKAENLHVRMCCYYPFLGVVTRINLGDIYSHFEKELDVDAKQLEILCLKEDGNQILSIGSRSRSQQEIISQLAEMYRDVPGALFSGPGGIVPALTHHKTRFQALKQGGAFIQHPKTTEGYVPDYHFFLALRGTKKDSAALSLRYGLVLVPLRPPGIGLGDAPADGKPPFLGMRVVDRVVLSELNCIWESLVQQNGTPPPTDPSALGSAESTPTTNPAVAAGDGASGANNIGSAAAALPPTSRAGIATPNVPICQPVLGKAETTGKTNVGDAPLNDKKRAIVPDPEQPAAGVPDKEFVSAQADRSSKSPEALEKHGLSTSGSENEPSTQGDTRGSEISDGDPGTASLEPKTEFGILPVKSKGESDA